MCFVSQVERLNLEAVTLFQPRFGKKFGCHEKQIKMDLPGTSGESDKSAQKRKFLSDLAAKFIAVTGEKGSEKGSCIIDPESSCKHTQNKLEVQNFIRHFRSIHPEKANEAGFFRDQNPLAKKPRIVPKCNVPIDHQVLIEGTSKLIAYHNLPLSCFEWEGMKMLVDPIKKALDVPLDARIMKTHLSTGADLVKAEIANEVRGTLISLKIDSASRHNRHILAVLAQFALNGDVVTRSLGKYFYNHG